MSRQNNDANWIILTVALIVVGAALVVWMLDLDMGTRLTVFIRLVVLGLVIGVVVWASDNFIAFGIVNTWPLLLGGLWVSFWPALDYWAVHRALAILDPVDVTIWWDRGYAKWGILIVLVAGGYAINKMFKKN